MALQNIHGSTVAPAGTSKHYFTAPENWHAAFLNVYPQSSADASVFSYQTLSPASDAWTGVSSIVAYISNTGTSDITVTVDLLVSDSPVPGVSHTWS